MSLFLKDWWSSLSPRISTRVKGSRQYGGVLIITAQINGWDFQLLADTGAALTVITKDVAELSGIDLQRPERSQRVFVAHRQTFEAPVVSLNRVAVGSYEALDLEALVLEFPSELRIDGLLGVNFLEKLRPTFEFDTATLVLRERR